MFKEVSRIKQRLDLSESNKILSDTVRGTLAVNGLDGYPYAMTLNHYFSKDENRIYFHGGKNGYKMDCIKKDNRCSYTVIMETSKLENHWAKVFKSVIVFGEIHFVDDKNKIKEISRLLSYKFTNDDNYINDEINKFIEATSLFYIDIKHLTGKIVTEK